MTEGHSPDDFCYRHPDRVSYVLCQRCARTVCGQCQTPAAVGVHCPECAVPQGSMNRRRSPLLALRRASRSQWSDSPVTLALLGLMVVVYAGQWLSGGALTQWLFYWPPLTIVEPWRAVTSLFVHSESSLFHLLFNGYSLWVLGGIVERLIGRAKFLGLFLLAGLGGSIAVLWLAPTQAVIGASGAIFGLFGALFVIERSLGSTNRQLLIVLALNLVLGFVVPGISWQAHIGGLLTGLALAWGLVKSANGRGGVSPTIVYWATLAGLIALAALRVVLL